MKYQVDPNLVVSKTAEIVVAVLSHQSVQTDQLVELVRDITVALMLSHVPSAMKQNFVSEDPSPVTIESVSVEATSPAPKAREPAVLPEQSVTEEFIISLEDGRPYRTLRRHLMSKYKMTPDDYRRKWDLPADYPMVAPGYARARSEVAKRSGLGTRPAVGRPRGKLKSR